MNFMLENYIAKCGHPTIVLCIIKNENSYNMLKNSFYHRDCVSQIISFKNAQKMNLSVASNVLKQINSKVGGELYTMDFPKEISQKTMLIGIDVCHKGRNSTVGFCASINSGMNKYYSQRIIQQKGQEIVNKELTKSFINALDTYAKNNKKELPDHFIIYRDGVGDAMRK